MSLAILSNSIGSKSGTTLMAEPAIDPENLLRFFWLRSTDLKLLSPLTLLTPYSLPGLYLVSLSITLTLAARSFLLWSTFAWLTLLSDNTFYS